WTLTSHAWNRGSGEEEIRVVPKEHSHYGINNNRKTYRNYDGAGEIPESLTAVSWCDGDLSQIEAIKSMVDLYNDNNIIANKQNAARSGKLSLNPVASVMINLKL
ncbi:hypothetical protein THAOC_19179, partial [Thalassiosira oceanica]